MTDNLERRYEHQEEKSDDEEKDSDLIDEEEMIYCDDLDSEYKLMSSAFQAKVESLRKICKQEMSWKEGEASCLGSEGKVNVIIAGKAKITEETCGKEVSSVTLVVLIN